MDNLFVKSIKHLNLWYVDTYSACISSLHQFGNWHIKHEISTSITRSAFPKKKMIWRAVKTISENFDLENRLYFCSEEHTWIKQIIFSRSGFIVLPLPSPVSLSPLPLFSSHLLPSPSIRQFVERLCWNNSQYVCEKASTTRRCSQSAIKPDKSNDLFRDAEMASSDVSIVRTAGCAVFLIRFRGERPLRIAIDRSLSPYRDCRRRAKQDKSTDMYYQYYHQYCK